MTSSQKSKEYIFIESFVSSCINSVRDDIRNEDSKPKNKNKNSRINFDDIEVFTCKSRSKNDANNKKRENIIADIINKKIPEEYYKYSPMWYNLKTEIFLFIEELCKKKGICIDTIECISKAGRCNHYDFKLIINNSEEFMIEFKYNAFCIKETPQFVSPMKPSKYLTIPFEPWYYDNCLPKIAEYGNLEMPSKEEYCEKIHNNKVECMKIFKEKYDTDNNFNIYCKKIDKEGIKKFIEMTEIDMDMLSNYLLKTQENKHYMCYSENKINYDTVDKNLYKITKLIKKDNTNYIYQTELGMKLEIKLRFKNGCGLQFPAFQIHRKVPHKKELKEICKTNNIDVPSKALKTEIANLLDKHNIIY